MARVENVGLVAAFPPVLCCLCHFGRRRGRSSAGRARPPHQYYL